MLILTRANVVPFLIDRGLLSHELAVTRSLQVRDVSARNRNFAVSIAGEAGFFIKQIRRRSMRGGGGPTREAACYRIAAEAESVAPFLPRLRDSTEDHEILVTELIQPAESLRAYYHRTRYVPEMVASQLGEALGSCHRSLGDQLRFGTVDDRQHFPVRLPGILTLDQFERSTANEQSRGQGQLFAALRRYPDLVRQLGEIRSEWHPNTLIHADMKWQNCLIRDTDSSSLVLVDWELADIGDAAWDVAGILQSFLGAWISATQITQMKTETPASDTATLSALQPAMQCFWQAYASCMGFAGTAADRFLLRSLRFSAARLVQTAYESLKNGNSLTRFTVQQLQLASNGLANPAAARRELLAIPACP